MAGTRAYHRWLIDLVSPSKGRLIGCAQTGPALDMDETVEELRFVAGHGFRATYLPGYAGDPMPPLWDRHHEPFWAACNDLNLVLTLHVGHAKPAGAFAQTIDGIVKVTEELQRAGDSVSPEEKFAKLRPFLNIDDPECVFYMDLGLRQPIWQLIFSGVFDRYPNLKLAVAECRADWVPDCKAHLDQRFLAAANRPQIKRKPSEYFGENIFIIPSSPQRAEAQMRHAIGVKNFLFGADYPHPEGTWPNTLSWLQAVFHDLPENELRDILGENAIRYYGLDKQWLSGIAAKIAPKVSDIIGDHKVDPRVIKDFELRAMFTKGSTPFEQAVLDRTVDGDLAVVSTAA
jgi:predicted TIM-barrel fold metal-dependent hydrolase